MGKRQAGPRRPYRWALCVAAMLSMGTVVFTSVAGPAGAVGSQPPNDWSFYINTTSDSTLYQLGVNQGNYDNNTISSSMVILDFGGLDSSGAHQDVWNVGWVTSSEVGVLADEFLAGYQSVGPRHYSVLAIGTNNNISMNSTNGGAFASNVNSIAGYASCCSPHETVWGANDIEDWSNASYTSGPVYNWYNGYSAAGGPAYIDFGSATGCGPSSWTCYALNNSNFNKGDYYNFAWGEALAQSTPEVYCPGQAATWYYVQAATHTMYPQGPLDDPAVCGSGYNAAWAWSQLGQYFPYISHSLEMHWA